MTYAPATSYACDHSTQSDADAYSEDCRNDGDTANRRDRLEPFSAPTKEQVDDDQRENQANATTAVVPDSGAHVVAAAAKEN